MEKIVPGKHVSLVYDLYAINSDGTEKLVHQSDPEDPEIIIYGVTQGVVAPLEKALDGLGKGDRYNVVAKAAEAFGMHNPDLVLTLDKDMFVVDGKLDKNRVAVGKYVPMLTAEGFRINGLVKEITDDSVVMDFNHQLVGKDIRFDGYVLDVRDATEDELKMAARGGCCGGGCGGNCEGDGCGDGGCCGGGNGGCGCGE